MVILGIHDGHNSGATLFKDGEILASVSEERLVRKKNFAGYPKESIEEVIKLSKIKNEDLSEVVYASNFMHTSKHLLSKNDWYKAGFVEQEIEKKKNKQYLKAIFDLRKKQRINKVVNHLKISSSKVFFVEHHLAHAATAYYGSFFNKNRKTLILTCDGAGDGISSTVSIGYKNTIKRIASTDRKFSLGKIYSRVTFHLGLQPWEHDYKVMGLAPYGNKNYINHLIKIFKKIANLRKNSLSFSNKNKLDASYLYDYFNKNFNTQRFDNLSLAVQTYLEEQLTNWVKNCIKKTKIKTIVAAGGVFMNVKANLKILSLKEVKNFFVFPSSGDESLSFGAVWYRYFLKKKPKNILLNNLYFGRSYSRDYITKLFKKNFHGNKKYKISEYNNIEYKVASLLCKNEIVARFAGKSEWGARALGNRSILANPASWENIEQINNSIKKRDFWMPFAPSVTEEKKLKYFDILKNNQSKFMTFSYLTKKNFHKKISAAIHPRDKTARIHVVTKKDNYNFWRILKYFGKMTGVECVLNTSFNLHGFPLVYSPENAIEVFLKSDLKYLALENFLIKKCK